MKVGIREDYSVSTYCLLASCCLTKIECWPWWTGFSVLYRPSIFIQNEEGGAAGVCDAYTTRNKSRRL